ncbi:hypothetical protein EAH83_04660 [Variovorax ginsengisoli]|uniref:Transglycosylase SLT domain-containing protein n=1 Tax=Variovorax guangxiensis TaxID=1775474 RepID=A0A502E3N5_9BURK|nr:hypothetical protein EAH83_04660 [Variovorax ginsengisoli]TPG31050.1 hypothetical protein EAH82_04660 [Variovorax guangxiensis]
MTRILPTRATSLVAGFREKKVLDFLAVAQACAPDVHPRTLAAIVRTESGFNPFAIGVVKGRLERQPRSLPEAVATAKALVDAKWNASFGLGQINLSNLSAHALDLVTVFDPCKNLKAASSILGEAFDRARVRFPDEQSALKAALSAYYSGNFSTGFKEGYVERVSSNAVALQAETGADAERLTAFVSAVDVKPIRVIPALLANREGSPMPSKPGGLRSADAPPAAPKAAPVNSSVIFVAPQ